MAEFKDQQETTWQLNVTPYEQQKVLEQAEIDLYDFVDPKKVEGITDKLQTDDQVLLKVLFAICEDDAEEQGLVFKDFQKRVYGESLDDGFMALFDSLQFFFRQRGHRAVIKKMIQILRKGMAAGNDEAEKKLNEVDVNSLVKQSLDTAMNSQASQE